MANGSHFELPPLRPVERKLQHGILGQIVRKAAEGRPNSGFAVMYDCMYVIRLGGLRHIKSYTDG